VDEWMDVKAVLSFAKINQKVLGAGALQQKVVNLVKIRLF
jgi:hypothetical protein